MGKTKGGRIKRTHSVSNSYIRWAESLAGMLTTIKIEHGGVGPMLESAGWDDGKTDYALRLTLALRDSVTRIAKEMQDHVQGKTT